MIWLLLPATAWSADFYECIAPDGGKSYQLESCSTGYGQKQIRSDQPPKRQRVDNSNQPTTTQVIRNGLHFGGVGHINGKPYRMMVDTGASFVSMSKAQALHAGIALRGRAIKTQTANGVVRGILTTAETVNFAGHEVKHVPVIVQMEGKPFPGILLGMSYLRYFDLNMNGSVMSMTRK
jgi:clan AA aspartic protease (TIGR02281 family)